MEENMLKNFTILLAVAGVLIIFSLGVISEKQNNEAPCSDYANTSVIQLPARCLDYYQNLSLSR